MDHRAAVLTDVEREQVPAVGRREPRVRHAPDDPGFVRILQRRGLQPARADVGETNLIAARLQIADEEQVVAPERVEVPLASGNRDVALLPALRDDRERRPARTQPPDDRAAPVLRDARERPTLCQVGTSDLRPGARVVPDERSGALVDEQVASGHAGGQGPARLAGLQVDDRDGGVGARTESEQRAVGERELARRTVERRAGGGRSCARKQRRRGNEDEHEALHVSPTGAGPTEVPESYGPRGRCAS